MIGLRPLDTVEEGWIWEYLSVAFDSSTAPNLTLEVTVRRYYLASYIEPMTVELPGHEYIPGKLHITCNWQITMDFLSNVCRCLNCWVAGTLIAAAHQCDVKDVKIGVATVEHQSLHSQHGIPQLCHDQLNIIRHQLEYILTHMTSLG